MIEKILTKNEWNEWLKTAGGQYEVFAPAAQGEMANFVPLTPGTPPDFSFQNTRLSPKGLVQPPSEKLFQFTTDPADPAAHILKEVPTTDRDRLLVGVRPCDARAFQLVRINFVTSQYVDPWWKKGYERLILVGAACLRPCATCFCTSVGGGPFNEDGLDVLMIEMGDRYLLRSCTEKGEKLLNGVPGQKPGKQEQNEGERLQAEAEAAMTEKIPIERLKDQPLLDLFNAPFWEEIQFACINCGTCTFLCPTCWCFDIQDEVHEQEGVRMRNWDSCMYPLFTLHGSGHNPRGEKVQRVRQRFMHKLKYYVDKYGNGVACVGCGRCVQFCPVNIDIRRIIRLMNDYQAK